MKDKDNNSEDQAFNEMLQIAYQLRMDSSYELPNRYKTPTIVTVNDVNYNESEFRFEDNNTSCNICNGYYGPCFEDPTCATCHAFLYPNPVGEDAHQTTLFENASDDSDSGNDEPADVTFHHTGFDGHLLNRGDVPFAPPVEVEGLDQQLSRLSVAQHEVEINIEYLPPEVLMTVFQYLDEISLWSVGQVCTRWKEILDMHIRPEVWRTFTLSRWPLLNLPNGTKDWYHVYTSLMKNSWCIKCVKQMAAQEYSLFDEENSWRRHRLRTELRAMRIDPLDAIQAKPLDTAWCHWQASIQGPIGSPYEGGIFFLYIQIPYTYPMSPPIVRFLTRVFHPNISRHGDIGIDAIHHNWSLALTINKVLLSIQSLLTDPYCKICMRPEIGQLYLKNRTEYDKQARLWTWSYAMVDLIEN